MLRTYLHDGFAVIINPDTYPLIPNPYYLITLDTSMDCVVPLKIQDTRTFTCFA